jgi:hypothetical protein
VGLNFGKNVGKNKFDRQRFWGYIYMMKSNVVPADKKNLSA